MWQQLKFCISREQVENASEILTEMGASAVTIEDAGDEPILEPALASMPLWSINVVTALFSTDIDLSFTQNILQETFPTLNFTVEILHEQAWERMWMADFKPMCFGERLWICPSHCQPVNPKAINLRLDPGLAFGTGTHPTTALCLQWLDKARLTDKEVLDYGCGSGVLAIAALLLGAKHVVAVDIDSQALIATRNNLENNHIEHSKITIALPVELSETAQFEIILANILSEPLIGLCEHFHCLTKTNGFVVLSGILSSQIPEIHAVYQKYFTLITHNELEDWQLLIFQKS